MRRSGEARIPSLSIFGYIHRVNGTRIITKAGFMDCICSAAISKFEDIAYGIILLPCRTQVDEVWSNNDQKMEIGAKTSRIGPTELAASTSRALNLSSARSQNLCPGLRCPSRESAYQVTFMNPADLVSRVGRTRV